MIKRANVRVRLLGCAASTAVIALAAGGSAWAQNAPPQSDEDSTMVDEIVVTGFRASLQSAIAAKRNETGVVDVIKAEDIADFPDNNLAESIQRIPGVSIDRDAGEGRSITVRGLGADFTRIRVNGMEALATTGGTDSSGGANRGRGFDFNVFASELFNSITVRKTQAAAVEEGSLGATVDLQTSRPFDYGGFTMAGSLQGGYNDLSQSWDPRGAFLISNTWDTGAGRFGALISVAYSERSLLEEGFSSVRWDTGASSGGFCSPIGVTPINPVPGVTGATATSCGAPEAPRLPGTAANIAAYNAASSASTYAPRLPRYGRLVHEQQRLGITGSLQWRPQDSTKIDLDFLYADLDSTRQENFLQSISFSRAANVGGRSQTSVLAAEVSPDGDLVYGVFNDVDIRSEQRYDVLETVFKQATLNVEQAFGDRFRVNLIVGRAESVFDNPIQTTVTFDAPNVDGYSFDFRGNDRLPVISYPFDVTSAANTLGGLQWVSGAYPAGTFGTPSEIRIRPQGASNTFTTSRLEGTWDVSESLTLSAGVAYKKFEFDTFEFRRVNQADTVPGLPSGASLTDISYVLTGFGSGLGLSGNTPTRWLVPNLDAISRLFNIYCNCIYSGAAGGPGDFTLSSITNGNARGNNRSVEEEDSSAFVQAAFDIDVMGRRLRGDVGVRYVETATSASGYLATGGGTQVTVDNQYTDILPSLNLAYDVTDDLVVRFGAAKVMARPQLPNLTPGGSISTTGTLTVTTGNPLLEPFRATTFDTSVEWYFGPESMLSFAYFYKDIDTYIQTLRTIIPFNQTGLPMSLLPATFTGNEEFQVTAPINTQGGPLKGFEISYQQSFEELASRFGLPSWMGGFGVLLNYTRVESEIDYALSATSTAVITASLLGLSPNAYNATLYYEDDRLSARVSAAYRDDYLQVVPGRHSNDVEGKRETFNLDASASYKLTDRVSLTLEALNLTDEFNDQFISSSRDSSAVYHHTGRQLFVGARFRY